MILPLGTSPPLLLGLYSQIILVGPSSSLLPRAPCQGRPPVASRTFAIERTKLCLLLRTLDMGRVL